MPTEQRCPFRRQRLRWPTERPWGEYFCIHTSETGSSSGASKKEETHEQKKIYLKGTAAFETAPTPTYGFFLVTR